MSPDTRKTTSKTVAILDRRNQHDNHTHPPQTRQTHAATAPKNGTNFRHAVEFSRNERTPSPASRPDPGQLAKPTGAHPQRQTLPSACPTRRAAVRAHLRPTSGRLVFANCTRLERRRSGASGTGSSGGLRRHLKDAERRRLDGAGLTTTRAWRARWAGPAAGPSQATDIGAAAHPHPAGHRTSSSLQSAAGQAPAIVACRALPQAFRRRARCGLLRQ